MLQPTEGETEVPEMPAGSTRTNSKSRKSNWTEHEDILIDEEHESLNKTSHPHNALQGQRSSFSNIPEHSIALHICE